MIIQQKHQQISYLILALIILSAPLIVFGVIVYSNPDLKNYFNFLNQLTATQKNEISQLISFNSLPDKTRFFNIIISSIAFYILALLIIASLFFSFKFETKHNGKYLQFRIIFSLISVTILIFITLILLGVDQYRFSFFNAWVNSLKSRAYIKSIISDHAIQNFLIKIGENKDGGFGASFEWVPYQLSWFIIGLQVVVLNYLISYFVIRNNGFNFENNLTNKLVNIKKVPINIDTKFKTDLYFYKKRIFCLVSAVIIILLIIPITYLIYVFLPSTSLHKFIYDNYLKSFLFNVEIGGTLLQPEIWLYFWTTQLPTFLLVCLFYFIFLLLKVIWENTDFIIKWMNHFFIFFGIVFLINIIIVNCLGFIINYKATTTAWLSNYEIIASLCWDILFMIFTCVFIIAWMEKIKSIHFQYKKQLKE